ncbi:hypothetical protein [Oleiphilus sp. HI0132]|uniref:hypothetical protein n=1 Tax=Oleiphilus sp. HI0132 TaxID=1822270 RepID=UPI0012E942D6|nr:hypothetical protein [Oleiphilus sp. HI0132]
MLIKTRIVKRKNGKTEKEKQGEIMGVYSCSDCESPIQAKEAKFCTHCGSKIAHPVAPEYLIPGKIEQWNLLLIGFWLLWALGAIALLINSTTGNWFFVFLGAIGLVCGGIYLSKSKPIKVTQDVLIDKRKIRCEN